MNQFSVVLPVCSYDKSAYFTEALQSVLNQTLPPGEVIVSVDGPISDELRKSLAIFEDSLIVRIIYSGINLGPGVARHSAILAARFDTIAIMDADDISVPERFAWQYKFLNETEFDVVGGLISEFDRFPLDSKKVRRVPSSHPDVVRLMKWRQPINHVTIMFRRRAYFRSGGYRAFRFVEDYDLIYRMCLAGARFANVLEVLVYVRAGSSMMTRRRGWNYLCQEVALFNRMRSDRFLTFFQWGVNCAVRIALRLLPIVMIRPVYWFLRSR